MVCHRKTAACHVTNPSMCYKYGFIVLNCTLLYAIYKLGLCFKLERTTNLLEGGKGGEGRVGERGWRGDGGRVGRGRGGEREVGEGREG